MKKRTGILFAMVIFIGIPFVVRASEISKSDAKAIKSYGSIIYKNNHGGSVRIYTEDIVLLQEKLASVPDEIFDPAIYAHAKVREYKDITNQVEVLATSVSENDCSVEKVFERSISENDIEKNIEKEGKENT